MRFLFFLTGNSRRNGWINSESVRYGGVGVSGTDGSTLLLAEYLSSLDNEVIIAIDDLEEELKQKNNKTEISNNILYTNLKLDNIENKNFDFVITSLWFKEFLHLDLTINKGLIYWCHVQYIFSIDELIILSKKNNVPLGFVHISNWEKKCNQSLIDHYKNHIEIKESLIPNAIFFDIIEEVKKLNIPKKKNKFIFHASFDRGGDVAYDYLKKSNLENWSLDIFDYLLRKPEFYDTRVISYGSVDKFTLFKKLAESQFFLYPLVTPYNDIHKDTFGCVIAEAIALDCVPITYNVGAIPEYYNGYIIKIPFPENYPYLDELELPLTKDTNDLFKNNNKILEILNSISYFKTESYKKIKSKFNINHIGRLWVEYLNKF